MDEFSYLSVLIAVILGLAITQILQGFRGLLHARETTAMYWPSIVWAGLVLLIAVQSWWASFGLRRLTDWSFLGFTVVLLENACMAPGMDVRLTISRLTPNPFWWTSRLLAKFVTTPVSKL